MASISKKYKLFALSFLLTNIFLFLGFFSFLTETNGWNKIGANGLLIVFGIIGIIMLSELLIIKKINPNLFDAIGSFFVEEYETTAKLETEKFLLDLRNNIIHKNETSISKNNSEKETDILELMLANMGEIKNYYSLSIIQAKNSFKLAVSMCIIGVALIICSIIGLYMFHFSEFALIPFISGAIVEFIAGTTLYVYKNSLSQLNHYYESLHNNERFLSLVHLVSKISDNKRDEIYSEIIKTEISNCKDTNEN